MCCHAGVTAACSFSLETEFLHFLSRNGKRISNLHVRSHKNGLSEEQRTSNWSTTVLCSVHKLQVENHQCGLQRGCYKQWLKHCWNWYLLGDLMPKRDLRNSNVFELSLSKPFIGGERAKIGEK